MLHRGQQDQRTRHVVVVVRQWHINRLTHGLETRKMQYRANGMRAEHPVQARSIPHVSFYEDRRFVANLLQTL